MKYPHTLLYGRKRVYLTDAQYAYRIEVLKRAEGVAAQAHALTLLLTDGDVMAASAAAGKAFDKVRASVDWWSYDDQATQSDG